MGGSPSSPTAVRAAWPDELANEPGVPLEEAPRVRHPDAGRDPRQVAHFDRPWQAEVDRESDALRATIQAPIAPASKHTWLVMQWTIGAWQRGARASLPAHQLRDARVEVVAHLAPGCSARPQDRIAPITFARQGTPSRGSR